MNQSPAVALTIAGSDSGGGAGIQADLKTFTAHGVFGTSVITAVTAQNTAGVSDVTVIPTATVVAQLEAVLADFPVSAGKTGMLPDAAAIAIVADALLQHPDIPMVVDPVMVATSGARLVDKAAVAALRSSLMPLAAVITPNLPEAAVLTGMDIQTDEDLLRAGENLLSQGCRAVLLKGGHLQDATVTDYLMTSAGTESYRHPRLDGEYHGSGCTLAAAICANMACGLELTAAVPAAISYLQGCMQHSWQSGPSGIRLLSHSAIPSCP